MEGALKANSVEQSVTTSKSHEKLTKLFGHCFEMPQINDGDHVPVGGDIFTNEVNIKVCADFNNLKPFLSDTRSAASTYNLPKLKEWLGSQGFEINERLFALLVAFTKKFDETYPDNADRASVRRGIYSKKDTEIMVSDVFKENAAECAEIAALAQVFLQSEGVTSTYFSGDVLWSKDQEFSEEHSFIVIRDGEKVYLYDPTNPTITTSGKFPSIYTTTMNFDEEVRKGQKRFVTAKNILSKKEAFYGVNNGTDVWAEKHIV